MSKNKNEIEKAKPTMSQRFMTEVQKQFVTETNNKIEFSDYEKVLARDLFLKIDSQLISLEADRIKKNQTKKAEITWKNVNMRKLSMDAVHRINLGLDAMLPNHIHPVQYWNSKEEKYDLDLRIGYEGELYYKCEVAIEKPKEVRYELVYENDEFEVIMKSQNQEIETYNFKVSDPFDRGEVKGGFGYIVYDDPTKNKLVTVKKQELDKAREQGNNVFWDNHTEKMQLKTVVHRTMSYIKPDPKKVNARSYAYVEEQENYTLLDNENVEENVKLEIEENANKETLGFEKEKAEDAEYEELPKKSDSEAIKGQQKIGPGF
jgi:recombination protein RecT